MLFVPGGGSGAGNGDASVVWNPGAAASPDYVTTWAEVMTAFGDTDGAFQVSLNTSGGGAFTIPAGTYALDSRLSLSRPAPAEGQLVVDVADGAILQNLAGVYRNITLRLNPTAAPALELDNGRAIEFDLGVILENQGSYAGLEVAAGETVGLGFYRRSRALATSDVIADLTAATARLNATFQSDSQASTDWVSGAAGTTLDYRVDASYTPVTLASPPATVATTATDLLTGLGDVNQPWWSWIDYSIACSGAPANFAGSFTVATGFVVTKTLSLTGLRFYRPAGAATIKCSIWSGAGVSMATVNVAVAAAGIYTATFASPVSLPVIAGTTGVTYYKVSMWENSATNYTKWTAFPIRSPAYPFQGGRSFFWTQLGIWGAGDSAPVSATATEWYPVEPIFVG